MEQALGNLVDNALRYGSGTVRLAAERDDGGITLSVADEGAGFPAEFLPHAFERFTRADVARARGAAGLGLALVQAVARAHGGLATAANAPGGGAVVALTAHLTACALRRAGAATYARGVRGRRQAVEIVFDHATKRYPGRAAPAVDDLTLSIPAGDICCLVGPSGGGKTTAMKLVNRLVDLTSGDVRIDGQSVNALDETELRRGIGYVIQQVGLFPHMTIAENVATVPKLLGWSKQEITARVDELLDLVDLPANDYRSRYASQISGGERQRVGLARALAADPPVMLMDEPFGALDPITRERLQKELLRIQDEMRKTIIFVTHDIDEAILIGNRIAILREGGVLVQYATPDEILSHPADDFVARFVGQDRGLKRLSLKRLSEIELGPVNGVVRPVAEDSTTLRDALSLMLSEGSQELLVVGSNQEPRGVLTMDRLTELLS